MAETRRMFESDLIERFSRIPPWQPPVLYVPVIVVLTVLGLRAGDVALPAFLALFLGGWLLWSLLEYGLHRYLFHYRPRTVVGRRLFWIMHGVHHDWPDDALRLVFPPAISLPLAVVFWWVFTAMASASPRYPSLRYPLMAGFVSGYLAYDMLHYWVHHARPQNSIGRQLRRHHMAHHGDDRRGFGVSSPLWDRVFGSAPR
jgi:sterol desaturase/sphingolipid hydroxylase (fatty acid hydroxylase superfamily)